MFVVVVHAAGAKPRWGQQRKVSAFARVGGVVEQSACLPHGIVVGVPVERQFLVGP